MAANRRFPVLLATRVTKRERALVDACAEMTGMNVTRLIRSILMPEVARRLTNSGDVAA